MGEGRERATARHRGEGCVCPASEGERQGEDAQHSREDGQEGGHAALLRSFTGDLVSHAGKYLSCCFVLHRLMRKLRRG